jgi:chaperonin GroEL
MAARNIRFSEKARSKLKKGLDTMADAVKVTLGPGGRNVILEWAIGYPHITKDGVKVARFIDMIKDPLENMGAQLVYAACSKTSKVVGDGTTTVAVLTQAFFREGCKLVATGANPVFMKRGIAKAVSEVVSELKRISQPVKSKEEISRIAAISANNDAEIGELVADAIEKAGEYGKVIAEDGQGIHTFVEVLQGMHCNRGYLSSYFVTDQKTMRATLENPYILIYDDKISSVNDLLTLLKQILKADGPLMIIADDVTGEALSTLIQNKQNGNLQVLVVKPPGFGDRRRLNLEDIAAVTGGQVISKEVGLNIQDVTLDHLGRCSRVIADKDNTFIVGGGGSKEAIEKRIREVKAQIELSSWDYDREQTEKRLARIAGSIAVIHVGAQTETALKEKKARVDNALSATTAASKEGMVPGGGAALIRCARVLDHLKLEGDENFGVITTQKALLEPARLIADNAGFDGNAIVWKTKNAQNGMGFNALTGEFGDLMDQGVMDPVMVTRHALQNAASIASTLLTTEVAVVDKVKIPPPTLENPHEAIPQIQQHMANMEQMGGVETVEQQLEEEKDSGMMEI